MNDDELLTAMRSSLTGVSDSLTDVHLDRPVAAITGRARARHLRRGLAGGAATAVALGVGLSLSLASGPAASRSVHVNLAAWSVNTTSTGQVELTLRELQDQALLEKTLADAGVPAIVNFGRFCAPASQADNLTATTGTHFIQRPVGRDGVLVGILIDPAAIPSGVTVDIGVEDFGTGHGYLVEAIVKDGAPLTCHPIHRVKVKQPPAATPGR
jgi:hypothetical protein